MLARSEAYDSPRLYSLDRIKNVELTKKKLDLPEGFNAHDFFAKYYGIIVDNDPNLKAFTVELRVASDQVKYFESLPLHASQTKVQEDEDYTIFQYHLVPTFDFKQEILSRGPSVKVLAPEWFVDEMKSDIQEMAKMYAE